jgi:hypothetical protein
MTSPQRWVSWRGYCGMSVVLVECTVRYRSGSKPKIVELERIINTRLEKAAFTKTNTSAVLQETRTQTSNLVRYTGNVRVGAEEIIEADEVRNVSWGERKELFNTVILRYCCRDAAAVTTTPTVTPYCHRLTPPTVTTHLRTAHTPQRTHLALSSPPQALF